MPPRSRNQSTDESYETETDQAQGHVVLTDMLTYTIRGSNPLQPFSSARAPRGTRVELDPELNDIERLVNLKAIGPDDGSRYRRTTAKTLAEAAGGREDPVEVPENLFNVEAEDVTPASQDDEGDEAPTSETPADDES